MIIHMFFNLPHVLVIYIIDFLPTNEALYCQSKYPTIIKKKIIDNIDMIDNVFEIHKIIKIFDNLAKNKIFRFQKHN